MKRILVLVALIYCANCISPCETTGPKDAAECFVKECEYKNNTCCFLKSPPGTGDITKCYELPKDESQREQYVKDNYPAFTKYSRECFGNFLEISLLLLGTLILL